MSYKVLIVDDSQWARMAVAKTLSSVRPEWTYVEAANAEEALTAMDEAIPDVVIVDLGMPGRDGLELAAELRRKRSSTLIAIISANNQRDIVSRAEAIGSTFLEKPLTEIALKEFLRDTNLRPGTRGEAGGSACE